jgi:hypothetical protein
MSTSERQPSLSDAQRAELLLACWWSHDGQWFLKTAAAHGLPDAMERNEDVIESVGRIEMRRLHAALGEPAVQTAADLLPLVLEAQALIGIPAEGVADRPDGFVVTVDECMVWRMTEAAELTDAAPGCRGSLRRRRGWATVFFPEERVSWAREFGRPDGDARCGYRFTLLPSG